VQVARNGREAVEALTGGPQPPPVDVVLMDLQMPVMDGYQATARIRADARLRALPIIAMTAHATVEEPERCLAAGMNDHVSKPIDSSVLLGTVAKHFQGPGRDAEHGPEHGADRDDGNGLDVADGLARVGGNRELYQRLLAQFVETQGRTVEEVADALARGDAALAERLAHTLKGVAGNLGAKPVHAAAGALEKRIRERAGAAAIEGAQRDVAAALAPLLAKLQAVASPAATGAWKIAPPGPSDPQARRDAAAELERLLLASDPDAARFLEANRGALEPLFADAEWSSFAKLIGDYEFDEARARLERALASRSG